MYVCMRVYVCVCMCMCVYMYVYVCVYVCVCVCVYMYVSHAAYSRTHCTANYTLCVRVGTRAYVRACRYGLYQRLPVRVQTATVCIHVL